MHLSVENIAANGMALPVREASITELSQVCGIVYLWFCTENKKVYIGKSLVPFYHRYGKSLERWVGSASNKHFASALKKYGFDKWKLFILERNIDDARLLDLEEFYIAKYQATQSKFGYNKLDRGNKVTHSEESRQKACDSFLERSSIRHGDKYDYRFVKYINSATPVEIICKTCCGKFYQKPIKHLGGQGCKKCSIDIQTKNMTKPFDIFVEDGVSKFGETFVYFKETYKKSNEKTKIFHKVCNRESWLSPNSFLQSEYGCPKCGQEHRNDHRKENYERFITKSNKKYNGQYLCLNYIDRNQKATLQHIICGTVFKQTPKGYLSKRVITPCPTCRREIIWQKVKERFLKNKRTKIKKPV